MTAPSRNTRICTSLTGRTCRELASKANRAISGGTDLLEFRLDSLRELDPRRVKDELGDFADRAIFTLRRADEGGGFEGKESEHISLLEACADVGPAFFDIELRTLNSHPWLSGRLGRKTIVSWHGLGRTPGRQKLLSLAAAAAARGDVAKIVPFARCSADNLTVLALYDGPGPKPIAFCMGAAGVFSRVMAIDRGTPVAYASLDGEGTAPGQLRLGQALAIRRNLKGA